MISSCIPYRKGPTVDIESKVIDNETSKTIDSCEITLIGIYYRISTPSDFFSNCDSIQNPNIFQKMVNKYTDYYQAKEEVIYQTITDKNGKFIIPEIKKRGWWPVGVSDPLYYIVQALVIEKEGYHRKIFGISDECPLEKQKYSLIELKKLSKDF